MHFAGLDRLGVLGLGSFGAIDPTQVSLVHQTPGPVQDGQCDATGQFMFSAGVWRRLTPTEHCTSFLTAAPGHVNTSGNAGGGGVTIGPGLDHGPIAIQYNFDINEDAASTAPNAEHQSLQVGPFKIPLGAREYTIHWEGLLPNDWASFIAQELQHDCSNCVFSSLTDATEGHPYGVMRDFLGTASPPQVNKDLVTLAQLKAVLSNGGAVDYDPAGTTITGNTIRGWRLDVDLPDQPIALVTRPDTGEEWGLYMVVMPKDPTNFWDSTTNPYVLNLFWRKRPDGVWDWIKKIVGFVINESIAIGCQMMPITEKINNPYTQGTNIVLKLSGQCPQTCPAGMILNAAEKTCACLAGMTYNPSTQQCVANPASTKVPVWVIGVVVVLGLGFAYFYNRNKQPSNKHPSTHVAT